MQTNWNNSNTCKFSAIIQCNENESKIKETCVLYCFPHFTMPWVHEGRCKGR